MSTDANQAAFHFQSAAAAELMRACDLNGPLKSSHEAYAVMLEELEEFKAEVFKKDCDRDWLNMRNELVQIAAMAHRTYMDVVQPQLLRMMHEADPLDDAFSA